MSDTAAAAVEREYPRWWVGTTSDRYRTAVAFKYHQEALAREYAARRGLSLYTDAQAPSLSADPTPGT